MIPTLTMNPCLDVSGEIPDLIAGREPLSPVGAGDSFVGAMARALEQGASLRRTFLCGMAAGTAALITPGSELCHKEDTEWLW